RDKLCKDSNFCVEFASDEEARRSLELVRFANVHTQKPLTEEELKFVVKYPAVAAKIMTVTPQF
ncbi:MAG TPA: hypothetical protein VFF28_06305, partial [Candidatus Nanoarchaeia archaeon]|nr:hypothetical protein [Candidatus Nanoarchaeia archaeon]